MNTAMKLMMLNGWAKFDKADDGTQTGGGGEEPVVETGGDDDDLDWLLGGDEEPEPEPTVEDDDATPAEDDESEEGGEEEVEDDESEESEEDDDSKEEEDEQPAEDDKKKKSEEPEEQEEAPKQPTEEEIAAQREEIRSHFEKQFAISEEDANLLVSEPEKVLPRLASNVMMQTYDMMQRAMGNMINQLPQMIQQSQATVQSETEVKNQFMELNPALKTMDATELDEAVAELAPVIKKRFPNATPQERMAKLGKMIAASYGLEAPAPKKAAKAKPPKPVTPAAPARSSTPPASNQLSPLEQEIQELLSSDD